VAVAREQARNPSYIHPVKYCASLGRFIESARCNWVTLAILSEVRRSLCRMTSSPPSTTGSPPIRKGLIPLPGDRLFRVFLNTNTLYAEYAKGQPYLELSFRGSRCACGEYDFDNHSGVIRSAPLVACHAGIRSIPRTDSRRI